MLRAITLVVSGLVVTSTTARADDAYVPPDFLRTPPELPASMDASTALRLDLTETLRLAVKQNLDLSLDRRSIELADLGVRAATGSFEPTINASYNHSNLIVPPSSAQEGMAGTLYEARTDGWSLGVNQRFSTGTSLDVNFGNGRNASNAGTAVEPINYRSFLSVRIAQPVLRGFSTDLVVPRVDILRAELASDRERQRLTVTVVELVARTEVAYWELLQAIYRYDLARRSLALAEDQRKLTQRQIDNGTVPPSDVIGAESTLAGRQLALLQEEQALQQATDQLRVILNLPRDQWTRPIVPTEVPTFASVTSTVDQAFAKAVAKRPELGDVALQAKLAALDVRVADNAMLPQLDVGLEGQATGQDNLYTGALGQLSTIEARGWTVMLNFSWTPLQRAAGAAADIARIRGELVKGQKEQLVQRLWLEVREAVRNGDSAAQQVRAAEKFRVLAEKSLDIEQRKFLSGTSQNILVAQRQDELANARLAELNALVAQRRAAVALLRSTGGLLEERRIELGVKAR